MLASLDSDRGRAEEFKVKGVTNRYNKLKDPSTMEAFNYVNSQSNPNEKTLLMRATVMQNREGFINGRELPEPNEKILR